MDEDQDGRQASELSRPGDRLHWWSLRLFTPGWSEHQAPEQNETVPGGWMGLDLVALGCAALVAGLGLRVCSIRSEARPEAPVGAAASAQVAPRPPVQGGAPATAR